MLCSTPGIGVPSEVLLLLLLDAVAVVVALSGVEAAALLLLIWGVLDASMGEEDASVRVVVCPAGEGVELGWDTVGPVLE